MDLSALHLQHPLALTPPGQALQLPGPRLAKHQPLRPSFLLQLEHLLVRPQKVLLDRRRLHPQQALQQHQQLPSLRPQLQLPLQALLLPQPALSDQPQHRHFQALRRVLQAPTHLGRP